MPIAAESTPPPSHAVVSLAAPVDPDDPRHRFPSDAVYRRLHWTFMAIIAAIAAYLFTASYFPGMPRIFGGWTFAAVMLSFNALWWTIADRRFARHIRGDRRSRVTRLLAAAFSLAVNAPILQMLISGRPPLFQHSPTWYAAAVTLWQLGLVAVLPIVALLRLICLGLASGIRRIFPRIDPPQIQAFGPTRRVVLKTAFATVPVAMLAGLTVVSRTQERRLLINRHTLPAPWLPDRLRGLTITHISDLHVGRLYRPDMLPHLIDTANGLKSDIVLITGDIVDSSNLLLPQALEALSHLTHRYGLFLCIGNHDQIDDGEQFIAEVRSRRFDLLINERRRIDIGGEKITIAGLDFAGSDEPTGRRRRGNLANAQKTFEGFDESTHGPVIALAHHPHTWDVLARMGVPLTLSGHTHGGQLMLTSPGERPDIGIGRILFRYTRGFYHNGPSSLFVNSGVGNWFPLRIHAPAEVVQIRLV